MVIRAEVIKITIFLLQYTLLTITITVGHKAVEGEVPRITGGEVVYILQEDTKTVNCVKRIISLGSALNIQIPVRLEID